MSEPNNSNNEQKVIVEHVTRHDSADFIELKNGDLAYKIVDEIAWPPAPPQAPKESNENK